MVMDAESMLRRFAAPLVAGRAPACGAYVGAHAAAAMGPLAQRGEHGYALWKGLRARAAWLDVAPPAPPSQELTVLLCAVHDLLSSAHPQAPTWLGRSTRVLTRHTEAVLRCSVPELMGEALSRHAVVEAALKAVRVDVLVSWWTGSAQFSGRQPSPRLLAWPWLRRVKREDLYVSVVRAGLTSDSSRLRSARRGLLMALLTASPLTPLVAAMSDELPVPLDLVQPGVNGEPTYASLRFTEHDPLRTALCDRALESGFMGPAVALTAAVNALLTTANPDRWAVVRALRLVATLHQRRLYAEAVARELKGGRPLPLADLGAQRETLGAPSVRMVYGLWSACRAWATALGLPGKEPELEGLAREVEQVVMNPQVTDVARSFMRAIETRVAGRGVEP